MLMVVVQHHYTGMLILIHHYTRVLIRLLIRLLMRVVVIEFLMLMLRRRWLQGAKVV